MSPAWDDSDFPDCIADWPEYVDGDTDSDDRPCACLGPHCRVCGCCEHAPCEDGCIWVDPTLCSRCV